jgi:hypothetical protein
MVSEQLKEDSELRNKWMNQLLTHEEKYQEGRVQMREMLLQAAEYEKRADEFLLNLRLDIDLGEQIEEDANANNYAMPFSFGATQQQQNGVFAKHKNCKYYYNDLFEFHEQKLISFFFFRCTKLVRELRCCVTKV